MIGAGWLGWWVAVAVFIYWDCRLFEQGYDTYFQYHKTDAEKELQQLKIKQLRDKVESHGHKDKS